MHDETESLRRRASQKSMGNPAVEPLSNRSTGRSGTRSNSETASRSWDSPHLMLWFDAQTV